MCYVPSTSEAKQIYWTASYFLDPEINTILSSNSIVLESLNFFRTSSIPAARSSSLKCENVDQNRLCIILHH
eukprot:m.1041570 g.1041570  ORF g.1041570 m.1041570 type:complete len:72 (+) comp24159_c0_seq22:2948-3163(+)